MSSGSKKTAATATKEDSEEVKKSESGTAGMKRSRPTGLKLTGAERAELNRIAAKRAELEENLRNVEKQLGDLETTYLDATTAESTPAGSHRVSGYGGNLMRGWDALVTSSGPTVKAAQMLKGGKHRYGPYERIFSLSSVSSPASVAMRQQQYQSSSSLHHGYYGSTAADSATNVFYSSLFAKIVNSKREIALLGIEPSDSLRSSEKMRSRRLSLGYHQQSQQQQQDSSDLSPTCM